MDNGSCVYCVSCHTCHLTANDERALKGIQTDRRSDIERSDDLIKAMSAEVAIDGQRQRPEDEVAER